jgi:hypothetical protein
MIFYRDMRGTNMEKTQKHERNVFCRQAAGHACERAGAAGEGTRSAAAARAHGGGWAGAVLVAPSFTAGAGIRHFCAMFLCQIRSFYQDGLGCLNVGIRWKGDAFLQGMTLLGFSEMYHGARRYLICDGSDPASGSCATVILMPEQVREVR